MSNEIPRGRPKPPDEVDVTRTIRIIPAKPTIEPTDRSNSPAIMRREIAIARMPSGAAALRMAAVVCMLTKLFSKATIAKNTQTTIRAMIAPKSGRLNNRPKTLVSRVLSSRV